MEQRRLLRCHDDGRQTNVAPNTLYEAVLNVSAAALFISVEAGGRKQDAASDGGRPCFAALPPTWLALGMQGTSTTVIMR